MELVNNTLPLFVYFLLLFIILKRCPVCSVLFFYLLMQHIKNILSNYYVNVNAPVFMREVEKYSVNDYSLFFLVLLYLMAFLSIYLVYRNIFKRKFENFLTRGVIYKTPSRLFANFFISLTLLLILMLIVHILSHNTPLFNDQINKNNYWTDYALFPEMKFLSSQLSFLLFIVGYLYAKQNLFKIKNYTRNFVYYVILTLSVVYYLLMKQKFGGPLLMIFSFYMSYLLLGIFYKKVNIRKILYTFLISISLLSTTVYGYFYMRFGDNAVKMILERIFILQSEIWEVTYQYLVNGKLPFDKNEFLKELSILFGFKDSGYTGMHYVMSKVMEPDYFNFFMNIKINLSSAYPSYLFYLFKDPLIELPIILLVNFILYTLYVYVGFKMFEKLLMNKIITAALYLKLFFLLQILISQVYINKGILIKGIIFILLIFLVEGKFFKLRRRNENPIYKRN